MSEGFQKFIELENRIYRIIEVHKATRAQKETLEKDFTKLKARLDQVLAENERLQDTLREAEKEREIVRQKVEKILTSLGSFSE